MSWEDDQKFERDWHGDCVGTEFGERLKQTVYARKMGLRFEHDGKSPFVIDCGGKSIVDIGGGPYSMLLFCRNVHGLVVDPCLYPDWIYRRYQVANIGVEADSAEEVVLGDTFDEAWIYNCLQHTKDPAKVIEMARESSKLIRIFEWINTGISPGHPHNLTADRLDEWLGGEGKVETLNDRERGLVGTCYYGVFPA
jgi:hypothetical protein